MQVDRLLPKTMAKAMAEGPRIRRQGRICFSNALRTTRSTFTLGAAQLHVHHKM